MPAPRPEYLLSALSACTAMTLRMYAEEMKQLPLTRVSVALNHEKITVDGTRKIDRIDRRITLTVIWRQRSASGCRNKSLPGTSHPVGHRIDSVAADR